MFPSEIYEIFKNIIKYLKNICERLILVFQKITKIANNLSNPHLIFKGSFGCVSSFWLQILMIKKAKDRSSHLEVFLEKSVLKICSKFTEEHECRSAISIKLLHTTKFGIFFPRYSYMNVIRALFSILKIEQWRPYPFSH